MSSAEGTLLPGSLEGSVVQKALGHALEATGVQLGNVQLIDWSDGADLRIVAEPGFDQDFPAGFTSVTSRSPCACGRALMTRKPVVVRDVQNDDASHRCALTP